MSRNKISKNETKLLREAVTGIISRNLLDIIATYEDNGLSNKMAVEDIKIALKKILKTIDDCQKQ